jgi:hypothetical protein
MSILALLLTFAAATPAGAPRVDGVQTSARDMVQPSLHRRADADLNGDGRNEIFLYVDDPGLCGSGGCSLIVLSPRGSSYRKVMRTTITKLPITILRTTTHGWRDVGVTVQGGGIMRPYMARLRFNGTRYPSNPTVPPALPLRRPAGRVLIGR